MNITNNTSAGMIFSLLVVIVLGICLPVFADDFRVDNEFQWVSSRSDTVKSTVYFIGTTDFISVIKGGTNNSGGEKGEITFYTSRQDTEVFTLLNSAIRIQTLLDVRETKKNIEEKRKTLETRSEPLLAFVAKPVFNREDDKASGAMTLQSPWFDYRIETETADAVLLKRYLDFCDASCYLNFRINPALPAPLVRLKVNEILRQESRFPKMLEMSFFLKGKSAFFSKEEKAKSTHRLVVRLDDADRKTIAEIIEYVRTFTVVPFDEYQKQVNKK
ncbi:hypothetical protein FACS189427_01150 [Planctomycetales bacterium]|nr:hypothetical protein FACS189427_01150 [Planctomycetales bacterium]